MVANAGIARYSPITEHSVEDWDRVLEVNARGAFLCVKHAARHMIAQGRGGRIICLCFPAPSPVLVVLTSSRQARLRMLVRMVRILSIVRPTLY